MTNMGANQTSTRQRIYVFCLIRSENSYFVDGPQHSQRPRIDALADSQIAARAQISGGLADKAAARLGRGAGKPIL
jgi:hypothetical protein